MLLCQNPATDWQAWGREGADPLPDLSTASLAAGYVATCRNPARDVTAWLAAIDGAPIDSTTTTERHISDAANYVQLCQNPAKDWRAWLAASDTAPPAAPDISDVANYVQLCQNPAKDWRAWLADHQPRNTGGRHDYMESTERLCRVELYEMQGWMDSHQRGRGVDYLPTGSTADSVEFDDVQPLRAEGGIDPAASIDAEAMCARRFGMLESFMRATRSTLARLVSFHKGSGNRRGKATRKGKGRATSGGNAYQLRKAQKRTAKLGAFLQRLMKPKAKGAPQRPPVRACRERPPEPSSPEP